jgi:hypothetical protein
MSRSPKYAQTRLTEQRQREIEQRRRAREEERRRQQAEARRRRFEAQRGQAAAAASQVEAILGRTAPLAAEAGLGRAAAAVAAKLAVALRQVESAADDGALRRALRSVKTCESELGGLELQVAGAIAQRDRSRHLEAARMQGSAMDPGVARRFDPEGGDLVERGLWAMNAALEAGDHSAFDRARAAWAGTFARHAEVVRERHAAWAAERSRAVVIAGELAEAVAGIVSERTAAGLPGDPEAALASVAALLAQDLQAERHTEVIAMEPEVRRLVETRTAELDDWLDDRERVAAIVDAITQALPGLGLRVDRDSLRESDEPRGMVHFRAERPDVTVQIAVVPDGRGAHDVVYELQGLSFEERREGGRLVHACPSAEALLERLHAEMRPHGVETGPLQWEGKPGTRPDEHVARPIPVDRGRSASE